MWFVVWWRAADFSRVIILSVQRSPANWAERDFKTADVFSGLYSPAGDRLAVDPHFAPAELQEKLDLMPTPVFCVRRRKCRAQVTAKRYTWLSLLRRFR